MQLLSKYFKLNTNYVLVLILIFFTANTIPILREIVSIVIITVGILFYYIIRGNKFSKHYGVLLLIALAYTIGYFFQFHTVNLQFTIRILAFLTISYVVIRMTGLAMIDYFEDIVYKLSVISLFLFVWQIVDFDSIFTINGYIEKLLPFGEFGGSDNTSSVIFVIKDYAPDRNSGFMWEPGAFAAVLSFPIFFNLLKHRFVINKRLVVLIIAMISTFSTMGYIVLLILGAFYYFNKVRRKNNVIVGILGLFVLIPLMIFVLQQDFMIKKIQTEYMRVDEVIDLSQRKNDTKKSRMSLGRMASLKVDVTDFFRYPIIGFGGQDEALTKSDYIDLTRTNGWGRQLRTFGIIGVILLIYNLMKTGRLYRRYYCVKKVEFYFIAIFFVFTFSNGVIMTPLFLCFQWLGHIVKLDDKASGEKIILISNQESV